MSWAFLEIFVPLVLALLLGFLIGWLVFKWRRRVIHASEWNRLTTNAHQAQADVAAVRAAYEEANNERKIAADQVASLTVDLETARADSEEHAQRAAASSHDLASSQEQLDLERSQVTELEGELTALRGQLAKSDELASDLERVEEELAVASMRATELEATAADGADAIAEVEVLEAKIAEQDRTIAQHKLELKDRARLIEEHEQEVGRLQAELTSTNDKIEALESGTAAAALVSEHVTDADTRVAEMQAALTAARTELDVSQGRIADFDARLTTARADLDAAHARVSELEARAHGEGGVVGAAEQIGQLRVDIAERDRRIAALEAAALEATSSSDHTSSGGVDASTADGTGTAPALTAVGTAGADHLDDLQVINGIGPRMEELLNTLGITSWEQLAGLDDAEVAVVDGALEEFPGRIARDQWVDQAKDLVARYPDIADRPTSATYRHRLQQDEPKR